MNQKLTIILTIKNRPSYTRRWLKYAEDNSCDYKILIADGGDDRDLECDLTSGDKFPKLDYKYKKYPFDETWTDYTNKLTAVLDEVKTPYVIHADDDDFFKFECLGEMLNFLESNSDYSAVRGLHADFELIPRDASLARGVFLCSHIATTCQSESIENACAIERIESLCHGMSRMNYYMNWYGIVRIGDMRKIREQQSKLQIKEPLFYEFSHNVLLASMGKIKVLPYLYYIRQIGTSQCGDFLIEGTSFLERLISGNGLSDMQKLVDFFAEQENDQARSRLCRCYSLWLMSFVAGIYNYQSRKVTIPYRLYRSLRYYRGVQSFTQWLRNVFLPSRPQQRISLEELALYISSYEKKTGR